MKGIVIQYFPNEVFLTISFHEFEVVINISTYEQTHLGTD